MKTFALLAAMIVSPELCPGNYYMDCYFEEYAQGEHVHIHVMSDGKTTYFVDDWLPYDNQVIGECQYEVKP